MSQRPVALALLLWLALLGCRRSGPPDPPPPPSPSAGAPRELRSPASPGSGEPNLAVAPDGRMFLTWIEPLDDKRHALRYAVRTKGGDWSAAHTIAEGSDWFVNWADFPSLAALDGGVLFAHWLARSGGGTYSYDVRVAASRDGGKTWSAAVTPHRDGTEAEHGFVSLVPGPNGRLGVIWLDGRKTAGRREGQGDMALMATTLGADGRLSAEMILDGRVCDCCQTAAVRTAEGVLVAYRDRSQKEVRDISVVRESGGHWSEPQPLAPDGWLIEGCPVNGPSLAAEGRRVALAWFAAPQDKGRVSVAFSSDAGRDFGAPIRIDDGRPIGRVDVVLLAGGDALVSWLEHGGEGAELRVRRVGRNGPRGPAVVVADASAARSSGFPRMEAAGSEVLLAWRDPADPPRVRTAVWEPGP